MADAKTSDKKAVAKFELLDAQGNVVEKEADAYGVRRTHLATGKSVDVIPQSDFAKRVLAVFGTKTLMGHEASQVKQKNGDKADPGADIVERFSLIEAGTWAADREAPSWDLDAGARAACMAMVDGGKLPPDGSPEFANQLAKIRKAIDDPKVWAQVRMVEGVKDHYDRLVGKEAKKPKTLDDLLTLVS